MDRFGMLSSIAVEDWVWDLAIGGVNHSIAGNGGDECRAFMPHWQRVLEALIFVPSSLMIVWQLLPRLPTSFSTEPRESSRYWVLTLYSLVFGAELAFKMISRTGIFLMNPCHITTSLQLALLSMDPKQPITCVIFRLQMYMAPGAVFALIFPVLNTRLLPGEVFLYYIQHIAILVVPIYLMYLRGAYEPEPLKDKTWPILGVINIYLYHFGVLQLVALYTNVNLNNILCPAISDPLGTRFYRLFAVLHQALLVPIIAKTHALIARAIVDAVVTMFPDDEEPAAPVLQQRCVLTGEEEILDTHGKNKVQ